MLGLARTTPTRDMLGLRLRLRRGLRLLAKLMLGEMSALDFLRIGEDLRVPLFNTGIVVFHTEKNLKRLCKFPSKFFKQARTDLIVK